MSKKQSFWLERHLTTGPHLALCTTNAQFVRALDHCKVPKHARPEFMPPNAEGVTVTLESATHGLVCLVCVRVDKKRNPVRTVGLMVHEAVHVWQSHKSRIGEGDPGDECEAYSIQAIAERLIEAYPKPKGGKRAAVK